MKCARFMATFLQGMTYLSRLDLFYQNNLDNFDTLWNHHLSLSEKIGSFKRWWLITIFPRHKPANYSKLCVHPIFRQTMKKPFSSNRTVYLPAIQPFTIYFRFTPCQLRLRNNSPHAKHSHRKTLMNPDKSRLNPSYSSFSSAGWWLSHPSKVSWDDDIPNINGTKTCSKPETTNQSVNSRFFSWLKLPHRRRIVAPPSQALRELADAPSGSSSGSPSGAAPSGEVTLMKHMQKLAGGFNPSEKILYIANI